MHETTTLSAFDAASIIIVVAAFLSYINHRFVKLPHVIGLTVMGSIVSVLLIVLDWAVPGLTISDQVESFINEIDFSQTLMEGMLSFLLFAGALHVDLDELKKGWLAVLLLSTLGVLLSTVIVGGAFFILTSFIGLPTAFIWCLVFGALISPTDPVSVLGILRRFAVPPSLQATVAGESLFNDGVGVVVFTILLSAAITGADFSFMEGLTLFAEEAGGGILVGLVTGYVAYRAMRSVDEYALEVLISLAVVMGGYSFCSSFHLAGPVAMAVAGLLIGNQGVTYAMSDVTRDYVLKFWELIDEMLNSVLFLLIGLEIIVIAISPQLAILGVLAIPLVLIGRALAVGGPMILLRPLGLVGEGGYRILVWGGLRGGISIALALSLPAGQTRDTLLAATFFVVLFSVLVQGSTIGKIVKKLGDTAGTDSTPTGH
ncbi:cation:proton antiporter [Novosphingopyxis baekryungensis]|uniref:cation:proton antiporter n=1 Tax=Novosphingopyxis baekryungensis TaxID=279369 RepID=UPI0003B56842|nr:sodium:proton antiporter [Novosphingopyxis baekryungensis]